MNHRGCLSRAAHFRSTRKISKYVPQQSPQPFPLPWSKSAPAKGNRACDCHSWPDDAMGLGQERLVRQQDRLDHDDHEIGDDPQARSILGGNLLKVGIRQADQPCRVRVSGARLNLPPFTRWKNCPTMQLGVTRVLSSSTQAQVLIAAAARAQARSDRVAALPEARIFVCRRASPVRSQDAEASTARAPHV